MGIIQRQSIKATAVSLLGAFIGFLTTFYVITKFLSAEEIGLTRVIIEGATLLASFALMGLNSSAYRFYPYFKSNTASQATSKIKDNGYFYYLCMVAVLGALIVIPLYILFKDSFIAAYQKNSPLLVDYFYWIIPLSLFMLFWLVFELYSAQLMRIAVPKLIREVGLRLILLLVYLSYAFHLVSLPLFIALFIGAYALCMLAMAGYIKKIGQINFRHDHSFLSPELKRNFLRYTLFYVVASIGSKLASRLDLFMVSAIDIGGLDSGGIFSIAFYMVAVIEIPSRSLLSISSPRMAEAIKEGDFVRANALFKKVSLHQLMAGGLLFLFIWINIDSVFAILPNGDKYAAGKWVVLFLGLAKLFELTLNYGNTVVSYSKYYHWNLYYTFLVTAVTILTNLWLIPHFGISGAAIATLISICLSYGIQQFMISFKMKVSPFSPQMAKLVLLLMLGYAANQLIPTISNPWLDMILRSIPIAVALSLALFAWKVSPEFNATLQRIMKK